MPRELINAKITHVSYVDKAANQKQFFFMKSEKQPDFQKEIKVIAKADDVQRLVYGIVYEPNVADAHGDYMTPAEIEKAAHGFLKDAREIDKQHDFQGGVGEVVESYIAPSDFEMGGELIQKGSWVLVTKASQDIWEQIQKGEITGYSMAGTADIGKQEREPASDEKGLFSLLKNFFSKGEVKNRYDKGRMRREFWAAQDALNSVLFKWDSYDDEDLETDPEKVRAALQDFVEITQEILLTDDLAGIQTDPPEEVAKAGRKFSAANLTELKNARAAIDNLLSQAEEKEENEEVKKEDLQKMLDDTIAPVVKRLEDLEKGEGEQQTDPQENQPDEAVAKEMAAAVEKALAPVVERVEALEKARPQGNGVEDAQQQDLQKSETVWGGLL
ncbi:XkdF-like putative serine protease domain-containing protein [Bacillus altitudinis]|uniref:XkdF-like putative serine protease domain-containing protein n=1 Tax=Bacillus TaxID=1386 RepID=UPI00227E481C|nr:MULTISPECIES: XkdF-like putative serine protease domain-containing protein [Bacillus]MCY7543905.1 XkdF-like putative serine protease domain-containing protein [Bacillus safensis]MCY7550393.1 XkdF-like putative serine protease domain-containing protein [Bacillus safensis]MCY7644041.1 XkdF-like putative serine protease domain-containing protein [Bacillus safensis]MCY7654521.1 XkdF-like putative serine protease domain-containing protein [Bacillus safensis]MEC2038249.1 XkdF-like putative serine